MHNSAYDGDGMDRILSNKEVSMSRAPASAEKEFKDYKHSEAPSPKTIPTKPSSSHIESKGSLEMKQKYIEKSIVDAIM
jgi:hypothetical protein